MNYATIKECDVANGPGVRVSLFVSGCNHHCKGCFNEIAWNFNYGNEFNEETINKNIEVLKSHEIDLDILIENIELLLDKELAEKIDKLIAIGKESRDISLMPSVLVKYDLNGLNNTINLLQISGLDPKKVPLMAY